MELLVFNKNRKQYNLNPDRHPTRFASRQVKGDMAAATIHLCSLNDPARTPRLPRLLGAATKPRPPYPFLG